MTEDAFYGQDWEKTAQKRLMTLPVKDRDVVERLFSKKRKNGNSERDLEKTARDISLFRRKFLPKKTLSDATLDDLQVAFGKLFKSEASYYTICDFRKHLHQFFTELHGANYNPNNYAFMRGGNQKIMQSKMDKMRNSRVALKQDEIDTLVKACKNWRDKAYIMVSYDVMARVGTLARLKIKDTKFKGKDIWLVFEKTKCGGNFEVGLTFSQPYFQKWMALHPDSKPEQYVFCASLKPPRTFAERKKNKPKVRKIQYGLWNYNSIIQMLKKAASVAGISKIHTHIFRRSGATFWKTAVGEIDQNIETRGDWVAGSSSLRDTYLVVKKDDSHKSAKARLKGEKPETDKIKFANVSCVMCGWENEAGQEYCFNCHHNLSIKEAAKDASLINTMQTQLSNLKAEQAQTTELLRKLMRMRMPKK